MAQNVLFNGVVYSIPDVGDDNYGQNLTDYYLAIPSGVLQKSGGNFTLTAEVNLGATYGVLSAYFASRQANKANSGLIRMAVSDTIAWRNNANSANLALGVNASDQLTFNGNPIVGATALTADRALISDSSGLIVVSSVTATELGYLSGVTGAIQDQIDTKAPVDNPVFTGTITGNLSGNVSGTAANVTGIVAKANGGSGQNNSLINFPASGTIATVPSAGVVKSDGSALSSSPLNLASEVTGALPKANGGVGRYVVDTSWSAETTKTVTVSSGISDARNAIFQLLDNSNNFATILCSLKRISATQVQIDVEEAMTGTYRLVGLE